MLRAGRRSNNCGLLLVGRLSEGSAGHDAGTELGESDAHLGVRVEDAAKDVIEVIGQRQDGLEESRLAHESTVGGILKRGLLPRVATTSQVDEDHSQTPDIIGGAHVVRVPA